MSQEGTGDPQETTALLGPCRTADLSSTPQPKRVGSVWRPSPKWPQLQSLPVPRMTVAVSEADDITAPPIRVVRHIKRHNPESPAPSSIQQSTQAVSSMPCTALESQETAANTAE